MKTSLLLMLAACTVLLAGCFGQNNDAADKEMAAGIEQIRDNIDALKKGQEAIIKELAEVRKLVTPKKREVVSDVSVVLDVSGDPGKGVADAGLTLVEFTDYQCPYCARHVKSVMPQVLRGYVDTGKVHYVIRDFPLPFHKDAKNAAYAAHCAGEQDKYWEMHDLLFTNQKALAKNKLSDHAGALEIDVAVFDECMSSNRYVEKVENSMKDGQKASIKGTPSFVVGMSQDDGKKVKGTKVIRGAVGFNVFKGVLDEMLKSSKEQAAKAGNNEQ